MARRSPNNARLARGVYALPFLSRSGHAMLVAVDSRGREYHRAIVLRRESETDVATMLEGMLERDDPEHTGG